MEPSRSYGFVLPAKKSQYINVPVLWLCQILSVQKSVYVKMITLTVMKPAVPDSAAATSVRNPSTTTRFPQSAQHAQSRSSFCWILPKGPENSVMPSHADHHIAGRGKRAKRFQCSQCEKSLCSRFSLKRHVQEIHGVRPTYPCPNCGRKFKQISYMKRHQLKHCGIRRTTKQPKLEGYVHMMPCPIDDEIGRENAKCFQCSLCEESFHKLQPFSHHVQEVHGVRPTYMYPCPVCGRAFKRRSGLKRHQLIHSRKPPLQDLKAELVHKSSCSVDLEVKATDRKINKEPMCDPYNENKDKNTNVPSDVELMVQNYASTEAAPERLLYPNPSADVDIKLEEGEVRFFGSEESGYGSTEPGMVTDLPKASESPRKVNYLKIDPEGPGKVKYVLRDPQTHNESTDTVTGPAESRNLTLLLIAPSGDLDLMTGPVTPIGITDLLNTSGPPGLSTRPYVESPAVKEEIKIESPEHRLPPPSHKSGITWDKIMHGLGDGEKESPRTKVNSNICIPKSEAEFTTPLCAPSVGSRDHSNEAEEQNQPVIILKRLSEEELKSWKCELPPSRLTGREHLKRHAKTKSCTFIADNDFWSSESENGCESEDSLYMSTEEDDYSSSDSCPVSDHNSDSSKVNSRKESSMSAGKDDFSLSGSRVVSSGCTSRKESSMSAGKDNFSLSGSRVVSSRSNSRKESPMSAGKDDFSLSGSHLVSSGSNSRKESPMSAGKDNFSLSGSRVVSSRSNSRKESPMSTGKDDFSLSGSRMVSSGSNSRKESPMSAGKDDFSLSGSGSVSNGSTSRKESSMSTGKDNSSLSGSRVVSNHISESCEATSSKEFTLQRKDTRGENRHCVKTTNSSERHYASETIEQVQKLQKREFLFFRNIELGKILKEEVVIGGDEREDIRRTECTVCGNVFIGIENLSAHMVSYHGTTLEQPYKCEQCGVPFERMDALKAHIQHHHPCGLFCEVCGKEFCNASQLSSHRYWNHFFLYPCESCGMNFSTYSLILKHVAEKHHIAANKCDLCRHIAKSAQLLKEHKKKAHAKIEPRYRCSLCDSVFETVGTFLDHHFTHPGVEENVCMFCPRTFHDRRDLLRHIRFLHRDTMHECPYCGALKSTKYHLEKHVVRHYEKTHVCETCGKKFFSAGNLGKHIKRNHGKDVGRYICGICDKRYSCRSSLSSHIQRHNTPYRCKVCGKAFAAREDLKSHKKSDDNCIKHRSKFLCDVCGTGCSSLSVLRQHMLIHVEQANYVCNICGKTFKRPQNLSSHLRSHSMDRNFVCDICGDRFKWKHNMENHQKTHVVAKRN